MTFALEKASRELIEEMVPLIKSHWEEITHYPDIPLEPNYEVYYQAQAAGSIRVYTVRQHGKLVGYSIFIVTPSLHSIHSLQAKQDALFIEKESRGYGGIFIGWCDQMLKVEGVEVTFHHVSLAHNFGAVLERLGYQAIETVYTKRLNPEAA